MSAPGSCCSREHSYWTSSPQTTCDATITTMFWIINNCYCESSLMTCIWLTHLQSTKCQNLKVNNYFVTLTE
jgi:hypothetical protein